MLFTSDSRCNTVHVPFLFWETEACTHKRGSHFVDYTVGPVGRNRFQSVISDFTYHLEPTVTFYKGMSLTL